MPSIPKVSAETLRAAYPRYDETPDLYAGRIERVLRGYASTYGEGTPPRLFSAPGRTEIGGNHTDHQHGCVLAAAIDLDILCAAAPNGTDTVRILSEGFSEISIDLSGLTPQETEKNTSAALIRGIAARLREMGYPVRGFDAYAISSVLGGSGLSSSAAYEVLIGAVMNGLFCEGACSAIELAQIGQYAENVFFGKPCGLMDQMASSVGSAVAIDFADTNHPVVRKIEIDLRAAGYALVIIDSGADHADLTEEYAAIPAEMNAVAACFGKQCLREVDKEMLLSRIAEVRSTVGDRAVLRALHFFADHSRAQQEAALLEQGDFGAFLRMVRASGQSSYMYLQNVCVAGATRAQEVAYVLALCEELLGASGAFRVHGGGFAGTVQAFVPLAALDDFCAEMERAVATGCCHVLSIRPAGGIELR